MKISLVNSTVTFFDSNGDLHLNNNLSKEEVEKIKELILKGNIDSNSKEENLQIETDILKIISPNYFENKKILLEKEKKVEEIKAVCKNSYSSVEFNKYFAYTEHGSVFYKGFENVIMPDNLVEHIISTEKEGGSILPYVRFWELSLANPDRNSRNGLFKFVKKQKLIITDNGYIVCYRRARVLQEEKNPKIEFILQEIIRLRKQRGSLNKYSFAVDKDGNYLTLDHRTKRYLDFNGEKTTYLELSQKYENGSDSQLVLTDEYTKTMRFGLGSVVSIPREKCDSNPSNECSRGLHIGSRTYVNNNSSFGSAVLLCLVNPSKVVAVPYNDAHKMRVCEYKIISFHKDFSEIEKFEDSNIRVMESDYINHEVQEIKNLLEQKTFDKENYSNNAEVFLQYVSALKNVEFSKSDLLIKDEELQSLRNKIK